MTAQRPGAPRDPGEVRLEELLRRQLHAELADGSVAAGPLTHGARRRASQIRRRRAAAGSAGLAIAVAGIAFTTSQLHRDPVMSAGPTTVTTTVTLPAPTASSAPRRSTTSATASSNDGGRSTSGTTGEASTARRSVTPSWGPTGATPEADRSTATATPSATAAVPDISAQSRLAESDFPWPMARAEVSEPYRNSPTAMFQACSQTPGPNLLNARQITWDQGRGNSFSQYSATEVITVWQDASAGFADLVNNTGVCRWSDPLTRVGGTDADTYIGFGTTTTDVKLPVAVGVRRSGDLIVTVTVYGPEGSTDRELVDPMRTLVARAATRATR